LAAKGVEVHSFDQRGWGLSVHKPSEKGLTGPTKTVIDDITCFIRSILPASAPLFLMGHSMGGAEVLTWINEGAPDVKKQIRGYLLESPFVAFNAQSKPSHFTVVMGRLLGRILPNRQMVFKLDANLISRDPETVHQFETDPLCHDTGTLEGLAGNLDRANGLNDGSIPIPSHAAEVYNNDGGRTKIFLSHGTGDGICDYHGTEGVYQRLDAIDDKVLKLYDGWYHRR
jgi:acylglycerol lipase